MWRVLAAVAAIAAIVGVAAALASSRGARVPEPFAGDDAWRRVEGEAADPRPLLALVMERVALLAGERPAPDALRVLSCEARPATAADVRALGAALGAVAESGDGPEEGLRPTAWLYRWRVDDACSYGRDAYRGTCVGPATVTALARWTSDEPPTRWPFLFAPDSPGAARSVPTGDLILKRNSKLFEKV